MTSKISVSAPGEEVIVSPYTMSASVVAPLIYGGVPVFADVEPETFALDIDAVEKIFPIVTVTILIWKTNASIRTAIP